MYNFVENLMDSNPQEGVFCPIWTRLEANCDFYENYNSQRDASAPSFSRRSEIPISVPPPTRILCGICFRSMEQRLPCDSRGPYGIMKPKNVCDNCLYGTRSYYENNMNWGEEFVNFNGSTRPSMGAANMEFYHDPQHNLHGGTSKKYDDKIKNEFVDGIQKLRISETTPTFDYGSDLIYIDGIPLD
ncbi:uncharacterized protein LOC109600298 [Aethina tumida]|uniref:uncharacterized protein LOC109600298 n=1 Tax=Aethina tumida TaxID=116153 RepID=UPI002147C89E|nr:uncharacterized protein LOC109600298 [Aethina tumida]